ncbi:hypothetical protein D1007_25065 [Hordeum vulgare]|nr:hypothetical protein D1007_25065 [Hordeum vulgare]
MSGSSVESKDGRSTAAAVVTGDGSSRNLLERAYPQEVWRRGEPCLRPERSRVLLARTPSMDALEALYRQFIFLASALGDGQELVTPAALLASIEACCGVLPLEVSIQSVKGFLKDLGGDPIEMIPPKNRRDLEVMVWLRDPSKVAKLLGMEIPEPKLAVCTDPPLESLDEFVAREEAPSYGSSLPKKKKTLAYPVICHLKEVVDRGPLLAEDLSGEWLPNEGEDLTRTHKFSIVLGKVHGNVD